VTPAQVNEKLQQELIKQVSIQHQFDAIMKLYEAATMMNNTVLMEQYREQLHSLLDIKLDTCNAIMELTRQLIKATGL
jgi:hypothetical protein